MRGKRPVTSSSRPDGRVRLAGLLLIVAARLCAPAYAQPGLPAADSLVDALARPLVEGHPERALVVGLVDASGARQVFGFGTVRPGDDAPPDARTLFEIGSITKGFTGLLLAEMAARGEVREDEPVAALLPDSVRVPDFEGRAITLGHLATHTSALPRLPLNLFDFENPSDPYAAYTVADLYAFLDVFRLHRAPGAEYRYSNLGMGLLGHALARRAGMPYEDLLRARILEPLGLADTRIALDDAARTRFAQGHAADGTPVPPWHLPTLAGAGALRASAADLLTLLHAFLARDVQTPLGRVLDDALRPRAPAGDDSVQVALGWHLRRDASGHTFVFHNGATGGFCSFAGFDEATGRGVVVLASAAIPLPVEALGLALLRRATGRGE